MQKNYSLRKVRLNNDEEYVSTEFMMFWQGEGTTHYHTRILSLMELLSEGITCFLGRSFSSILTDLARHFRQEHSPQLSISSLDL